MSHSIPLNLRAVDLQLLLALDVLLQELHVTRAAKLLGVSQPAMSHMLSRLRVLFDDPLIVRTSSGLAPTARALELRQPLRDALDHVRRVFGSRSTFDAATSRETFVVRMGDMNELLMLPAIARELESHAPGILLQVKHLPPIETLRALDSDDVHFAVSAELVHGKSIRFVELLQDAMVCIMRRSHPAARRALTMKAFLALRHVNIVQTTSDTRFVDEHLPAGARRTIALSTPHWLAAPSLVKATDIVASISRRMAAVVNAHGEFAVRPLPFGPKSFSWRLYWHIRYDAHPAHRWMRQTVQRACQLLSE